jgi:long-chain acyl-CoA synthetase
MFSTIQPILPETSVRNVITTSIADCYNSIIQTIKPLRKTEVAGTLDMAGLLEKYSPLTKQVEIDVKKDLGHLAYTGGTTGVSKGVMLTHYNLVVNAFQASNWFIGAQFEMKDGMIEEVFPPGIDPKKNSLVRDRNTALIAAPWFHAMGTTGFLNAQVATGNTMVVYPRFDPAEYIGGVNKYRADILGGAPQMYIPIINLPEFAGIDLSQVKLATSGAAPLARVMLDRLLDSFSGVVCEVYGLTECTAAATMNPPSREKIRQGSVGIPSFDTLIKIIDPDTAQELTQGEEGEVCIKGPQVMQGYWGKPEASAEVLRDGWLLTGDIGRMDEDGYLFITDRKKDLIIYKGYNVYPRELEEIIYEHPAVELCAVVGKKDPWGELPVACVQLKQGMEATPDAILEYVNSKVTPYKKLREVNILATVPVSAAGKILRKEIRNRCNQE